MINLLRILDPINKTCDNCKHKFKEIKMEPCLNCDEYNKGNNPNKWEPRT